jgi:hypothetical protein
LSLLFIVSFKKMYLWLQFPGDTGHPGGELLLRGRVGKLLEERQERV